MPTTQQNLVQMALDGYCVPTPLWDSSTQPLAKGKCMSRPTTIAVDGRRIRVRVDGDPGQPAVLLLHGLSRSLEDWVPLFQRLAGYRTIALDMPGFGFSTRLAEPMSLTALARGVAGALDALDERRRIHVVGNSLGGAVALRLLTLQPERVASMVLVNSAGFGSEVSPLIRMLAIPGFGSFAARHPSRASARMAERSIYADKALATRERIDHALAIARQPEVGPALHEIACELGTGRGIRRRWRVALLAEAARFPRPTLVVWGDRDRILPPHQLNAARRLLPHATTRLFEGIGHMPQIECPDEFAELLTDFMSSLPSSLLT
jgi:pimeloyl-ACP methyl ester carboxylesterase